MESFIDTSEILHNLAYLGIVVLLIFIGKWILDYITTYELKVEFTEKDNLAISLSTLGYIAGISIICTAAATGESISFVGGLLELGTYGFLGIALLLASKYLNDWFILREFSIYKELVDDKNPGTGAVLFGTYICSALIIAGAITGHGGGPITVIAFFLLGQILMVVFTQLYQLVTPFDLHKEIERDNVAAGVAFGGTFIAIGILLFKGLEGDFIGWKSNLIDFGIYSGIGLILLPSVRFLFIRFFVWGVHLDREISEDQNIGIGMIEASISIMAATWILFIV